MASVLSRATEIDRASEVFRRRLVLVALKTVAPVDGMYEDTEAARSLLDAYNARPIDEAESILRSQRLFPFCVTCDYPVVDGKAHNGYCADERGASRCSSLDHDLSLAEYFEATRCASDDCHHLPVKDTTLCSCCQKSLVYKCITEGCQYLASGEKQHCLQCVLSLATPPEFDPDCMDYADATGVAIGWMICSRKGCSHMVDPSAPGMQGHCKCCD